MPDDAWKKKAEMMHGGAAKEDDAWRRQHDDEKTCYG